MSNHKLFAAVEALADKWADKRAGEPVGGDMWRADAVDALYELLRDARSEATDEAAPPMRERADAAARALAATREYVDYPGNWSAMDHRPRLLLALLDGEDVKWAR